MISRRCPNCGTYNYNNTRNARLNIGLLAVLMTLFFIVIPIVGWFLAPFMFLIAIGCLISGAITNKNRYHCKACSYKGITMLDL
jgi:hypothetical protein